MNYFTKNIRYFFKFLILLFIFLNFSSSIAQDKEFSVGKNEAKIEILVYSSLTCPHCADFHEKVYPLIKKKYVDTGKVKIFFKDFPLDLAALNAAKLVRCVEYDNKLNLLDNLYKNQKKWIVGSTIEEININLINIASGHGINAEKAEKCISNEAIEEAVLNNRIDGQKKFNINSTPTVIINKKKIEDGISFENIEKVLKKII